MQPKYKESDYGIQKIWQNMIKVLRYKKCYQSINVQSIPSRNEKKKVI